ncbi:hypothetical protein GOAMI_16_01580 [Gordonia amicalis NBRC 100051 = JCM 11271]|nr:hypothetical protein GOAMI_16_01580 [Gordonia amicalis NBRC 100051 = JCM 11271]
MRGGGLITRHPGSLTPRTGRAEQWAIQHSGAEKAVIRAWVASPEWDMEKPPCHSRQDG